MDMKTKTDQEMKNYLQNVNVPMLTTSDDMVCNETITLNKCEKALNSLRSNKSPGNDGLSIKFYIKMFGKLLAYHYLIHIICLINGAS